MALLLLVAGGLLALRPLAIALLLALRLFRLRSRCCRDVFGGGLAENLIAADDYLLAVIHAECEGAGQDIEFVDDAVNAGGLDPLAALGKGFAQAAVGLVFIIQATEQAAALAGDLARVECQVLLLGHLDRHRLEIPQPGAAAEFPTADADAAGDLGLVTDADLAHLDPGVKGVGQILDQVAEIDPAVSGKEEHRLAAVEQVFNPHQLHLHVAFDDAAEAEVEGLLLLLTVALKGCQVVAVGLALDGDQLLGAFVGALFGGTHDLADAQAPFGLDDNPFPRGDINITGVEVV